MSDQFFIGDIVKLRSGGPEMTVKELKADSDGLNKALCIWFENDEFCIDWFLVSTIEKRGRLGAAS